MSALTGVEANVSTEEQIRLSLAEMLARGGTASTPQLYAALERRMAPDTLSDQGRATLRFLINRQAVRAGYVHPHDSAQPGWRITAAGREYLQESTSSTPAPVEQVTTPENREEVISVERVSAEAFEQQMLELMRCLFPHHAWYHQGRHKRDERGLDLIGTVLQPSADRPPVIGVQVKRHGEDYAPSQEEWLKFLAGCFVRKVSRACFITTGRLTSAQRREAAEGGVVVIEGAGEVRRFQRLHGLAVFDDRSGADPE